jgi:hypothetical protein
VFAFLDDLDPRVTVVSLGAPRVLAPAYLSRLSVDTCVDAYFELVRARHP